MPDAAYFIAKADQLLRLAKHARANSIAQEELFVELETMANEFMTKAVDIQTVRDRVANAAQV